jgi:hypothetical protein
MVNNKKEFIEKLSTEECRLPRNSSIKIRVTNYLNC